MKATFLFTFLVFGLGAFAQPDMADTILVSLPAATVNGHLDRVTLGPQKMNLPGKAGELTFWVNGMFFNNKEAKRIESLKVKLYKKPEVSANNLRFVVFSVNENINGGMDTVRYGAPIQIPCNNKGWCTVNVDSLNLVVTNDFFVGIESVATLGQPIKAENKMFWQYAFGPAYSGNGYSSAEFVNNRWYFRAKGNLMAVPWIQVVAYDDVK